MNLLSKLLMGKGKLRGKVGSLVSFHGVFIGKEQLDRGGPAHKEQQEIKSDLEQLQGYDTLA